MKKSFNLCKVLWLSSRHHEPYSPGSRALSSAGGAQDASIGWEGHRYLLFNHEAVIVIANWRMMEDLDLRRVISSLAVFKTAPLNRLGNHPNKWSRMQDLNLRLLAPKASVLPNCTNSRTRATMKVIATATKRICSYSSKPYISRKCLSGPMDVCILTFCMLRGIQVLSSVSFALSVSRSVLFTNLRFVKFALIYDHSVVGGQPLPPLSPSSFVLVDSMRFELMTSSLRTRRSSN